MQSVLGSVQWIRRHVQDVRPCFVLSNLLGKNNVWDWTAKHEEAWNDLQKSLKSILKCYVPVPGRPMVLVTDASEEGGGGTVLQLQQDENKEEKVRFLGHWAWKWSGSRANYSIFDKELLAGVLLLAGQHQLLKSATSLLWMTDQSAIADFIKGEAPEMKRRCRWWYFLKQYRLAIKHIPGVQNAYADYLSRNSSNFDKVCAEELEHSAKIAFQNMDEALDLSLIPLTPEISHLVITPPQQEFLQNTEEEMLREIPELREHLAGGGSVMLDGVQWTSEGGVIFRETRKVIPKEKFNALFFQMHRLLGHPGIEKMKNFLRCRYYLHDTTEADIHNKLKELTSICTTCARTKPNTNADRGPALGRLAIPEIVNSEIAIDLVFSGDSSRNENSCLLFICETLTGFLQVVPVPSSADEGLLAKMLWRHWVVPYGAPGRITADNDIRWRSPSGPWKKFLDQYFIDCHFTTPYRSDANGRLERRVQEFLKFARIAVV